MSQENAKLFLEKISEELYLQELIEKMIEQYYEGLVTNILNLANENGYEFNRENMKRFEEKVIKQVLENEMFLNVRIDNLDNEPDYKFCIMNEDPLEMYLNVIRHCRQDSDYKSNHMISKVL